MFPYESDAGWFWSGFYASRPSFKKQVKDTSAIFGAHSKLFARKVIDQSTSDEDVDKIMDANKAILDSMGIAQHHDAITGTEKEYVNRDYQ